VSNKNINLDKYISIASHEIKNSLNPVINLSALMLKENTAGPESEQREYLETIERNGRRILAIVDTLSYINRIKKGVKEGHLTEISLNDIAENSVKAVSGYYGKGGISHIFFSESGEAGVLADSELFKKIISCITGFYITLRETDCLYYRMKSDNGMLCVTISDADSGKENCPAETGVCDDFDRSILSETSLLWLSFAEEMISASGGRTEILKMGNGGVSLTFSLPSGSETAVPGPDADDSAIDLPREFVLMVVDDDPDTMVPLKAIAEHEFNGACEIIYAANGKECIDLLEKTKPDVILLDLSLPDISGFSLVRSIKNFFVKDDVPVIAFTGHDIGQERDRVLNAGFSDIILKPFDIDEFAGKIRKWKNRDD